VWNGLFELVRTSATRDMFSVRLKTELFVLGGCFTPKSESLSDSITIYNFVSINYVTLNKLTILFYFNDTTLYIMVFQYKTKFYNEISDFPKMLCFSIKVKRLDLSLNALLRLLRFKTFDRILKQEGCKLNQYISNIRNRHAGSRSLIIDQVCTLL